MPWPTGPGPSQPHPYERNRVRLDSQRNAYPAEDIKPWKSRYSSTVLTCQNVIFMRCAFDTVRRAGCPHPAKPGRRNHWARSSRSLAMAACGHAALRPQRSADCLARGGGWAHMQSAPTGCARRWCMQHGGAARAAMKAAPTPPAFGPLVGAAFMAARNRVPISAGVRWFLRRRGALYMRPCRTAGITGPAAKIAGITGRIYNPPLRGALGDGACNTAVRHGRP